MSNAESKWPLRAKVWKRESTQEWVLEIEGTLGETSMVCRHTQPLSVAFEDVPGLPTLYPDVTLTDAWQDLSACPDGDVWFSLSCGHVALGHKHGSFLEWGLLDDAEHDCCSDAKAIKATPIVPPAHHSIAALREKELRL